MAADGAESGAAVAAAKEVGWVLLPGSVPPDPGVPPRLAVCFDSGTGVVVEVPVEDPGFALGVRPGWTLLEVDDVLPGQDSSIADFVRAQLRLKERVGGMRLLFESPLALSRDLHRGPGWLLSPPLRPLPVSRRRTGCLNMTVRAAKLVFVTLYSWRITQQASSRRRAHQRRTITNG